MSSQEQFEKFGLADTKTVLRWLGSSHGTSRVVVTIFFMHMMLTGFIASDSTLAIANLNPQIQDLITAGLTGVAVLLVGRISRKSVLHPVRRNIFIWLLGSIVGGLALFGTGMILNGTVESTIVTQALNGLIVIPIILGAYTLLVSSWLEVRIASDQLEKHRKTLFEVGAKVQSEITATSSKVQSLVRDQISPVLTNLKSQISEISNSEKLQKVSDQLLDQISTVIRPVSWQIDREFDFTTSSISAINSKSKHSEAVLTKVKHNLGKWLRVEVKPATLVSPLLNTLAYAVFLIPASEVIFGRPGVLAAIVTTSISYFVFKFLQTTTRNLIMHSWKAIVLVVATGLAVASTFTATVFIAENDTDIILAIAASIAISLTTILIALFQAITYIRTEALSEISTLNERINSEILHLQQSERVLRKNYSRFIHGEVQAKLLTISLKLGNPDLLTAEQRNQLGTEIEQISNLIEDDQVRSRDEFDQEFARIILGWEGVLQISVLPNVKFPAGFASDSIAQECALEVLQEGFSNAVKHADAKTVEVKFDLAESKNLKIEIRNSLGLGPEKVSLPSLGSKILDEVTLSWTREIGESSVLLSAVVNVR